MMFDTSLEKFMQLCPEHQIMIVQMGMETFARAATISVCGWTTLKGALHYIPKESPAIIDSILCGLGGSEEHLATINKTITHPEFIGIYKAMDVHHK